MTISNSNGNISAIINAVMRDATSEGNRQADLTVALFSNEVTYSTSVILDTFRKEGKEKTVVIDTMLADVSDDFDAVMNQIILIKDKRKEDRTKADAFTVDGLNRKARAARIMFERALKSVYFLRTNGCRKIMSNKIGTGALKASMPDADDKGEFVNELYTCNELASKGDKTLRLALGKASAPASKAKNPNANVIADASKSLAAVLTSIGADGKRKPMTDYSDDVEANMEATLRELFLMKFADDRGRVAVEDVQAWLNEIQQPASKPTTGTKDAKAA